MVEVIILDFDGVIVDSMSIKTEAFRKLFKDNLEHIDEIVNYHLNHGAVSRHDKFSYIYENILEKDLTEEKKNELGEKFSEFVLEKILECPYIPGATEFLDEFSKKARLFVASGAPEKELKYIIKQRGLEKYFFGVFGSPHEKTEIIETIVEEESVGTDQTIYIGDSPKDLKAAEQTGVRFVGMAGDPERDYKYFSKPGLDVVQDFFELREIVN